VVLNAVPEGATVVGVPGKIVRCRDNNANCIELVKEEQKTLNQHEFDAYGVAGETEVIESAMRFVHSGNT